MVNQTSPPSQFAFLNIKVEVSVGEILGLFDGQLDDGVAVGFSDGEEDVGEWLGL